MTRKILVLILFALYVSADCQNNKQLSDYFPDLQKKDTIINSLQLWGKCCKYNDEMDTLIALKYFFDNDADKMHDIDIATNQEDPTEVYYTPYTKKIYIFHKIKHTNTYLLCYGKTGFFVYLSMYDPIEDKILNTFTILVHYDDYGFPGTDCTIFPNNYVVTVEYDNYADIPFQDYVLTKIDFETQKFVEIKRIKATKETSDDERMNEAFKVLGISATGELSNDANATVETKK